MNDHVGPVRLLFWPLVTVTFHSYGVDGNKPAGAKDAVEPLGTCTVPSVENAPAIG